MRIYLDEDVPRRAEALLRGKGHQVVHARDLPLHSVPDQLHYVHAVRQGADLIITCNVGKSPKAQKGNFIRNAEEHLGVPEKDFPVKVYGLWQPHTGNKWPSIEQKWSVHEQIIERHAQQLAHTDHEKRRQDAVAQVTALVQARRERTQHPEQERER